MVSIDWVFCSYLSSCPRYVMSFFDGRTERIPSIPKSPGVQCGGGLGCLLKCIEYLIFQYFNTLLHLLILFACSSLLKANCFLLSGSCLLFLLYVCQHLGALGSLHGSSVYHYIHCFCSLEVTLLFFMPYSTSPFRKRAVIRHAFYLFEIGVFCTRSS